MIFFLFSLLFFSACSLINQEIPNEAPVIERRQIDTLQVQSGGRINIEILATDEDDDPLFYTWRAYRLEPEVRRSLESLGSTSFAEPKQLRSLDGLLLLAEPVGGFRDSTKAAVVWDAPATIAEAVQSYLLAVTVRDRLCEFIADPAERHRCEEESFRVVEIFLVTVVQPSPSREALPDTAISFRSRPSDRRSIYARLVRFAGKADNPALPMGLPRHYF